MVKYLLLTALLPFIMPDLKGTYTRNWQFHEGEREYNRTWRLNLKADSSFTYDTDTFNPHGSFAIVTTTLRSAWTVNGDTLKLKFETTNSIRRFLVANKKLVALDEGRTSMITPYLPLDYIELK